MRIFASARLWGLSTSASISTRKEGGPLPLHVPRGLKGWTRLEGDPGGVESRDHLGVLLL